MTTTIDSITDGIAASFVTTINRIDTAYGYYYEARFNNTEPDFYIPFTREELQDGTMPVAECLPETASEEEMSTLENALAFRPNAEVWHVWEPLPAVRALMEAADRRWENSVSTWRAEERAKWDAEQQVLADEGEAQLAQRIAAAHNWLINEAEQDLMDEIREVGAAWKHKESPAAKALEEAMKALYDDISADRAKRGSMPSGWFDYFAEKGYMPDEEWARLTAEAEVKTPEPVEAELPSDEMLALFQADMATPEYRRMETRSLRDFAYHPPPYEPVDGSRHKFIIAEISRHVGLNPQLTDADIHYTATKLVDCVDPPFDRHRRWIEIKDGEKWGRRVRKQNQEQAERDLLLIQARRRLTNRLLNAETREQVAAILQGELWD